MIFCYQHLLHVSSLFTEAQSTEQVEVLWSAQADFHSAKLPGGLHPITAVACFSTADARMNFVGVLRQCLLLMEITLNPATGQAIVPGRREGFPTSKQFEAKHTSKQVHTCTHARDFSKMFSINNGNSSTSPSVRRKIKKQKNTKKNKSKKQIQNRPKWKKTKNKQNKHQKNTK